jgi:hypothetical protein
MDSLDRQTLERIEEIILVTANKALNRYSLRPGKLFGKLFQKERYQVLELVGNTIYYKEMHTGKVKHEKVDTLLQNWDNKNFVEISQVDEILEAVKSALSPFLAGAILSGLLAWLKPKLGN